MADEKTTTTQVKLEGSLTAYETSALRDTFLEAFESSGGVEIEWGTIEKADSAGVQVLLSAARTAKSSGKSFHPGDVPDAVGAACSAIGVTVPQVELN